MWGQIAGAAIGALGSYMGSKNSGQKIKPWQPYAGAKPGLDNALSDLSGMPTMQGYTGDYTAAINPAMQNWLTQGGNYGQNMMGQGGNLFDIGIAGYNDALQQQAAQGPRQFQYDQGLFNQTMNNFMPGLRSMVGAQGRMSSMGLQSNLGQLVSQAGLVSDSYQTNPMSKLGQGGAALTSQNDLNNKMFAGNLYSQAAGMGNSNAVASGMANLQSGQMFDRNTLANYKGLMNMGLGMQGTGLSALGDVGKWYQGYDQLATDNARNQFMDLQNIPIQDLIKRINTFSQVGGQGQVVSKGPNPWASALQGGVQGYSIYNNLFGGGSGNNYGTTINGQTTYGPNPAGAPPNLNQPWGN